MHRSGVVSGFQRELGLDDLAPDPEFEPPSRYNTTQIGNWLRLIRLPNLLTVPGDVVIGFMVMAPTHSWATQHIWVAMAAATLFYIGGIIFNDVVDVRRDLHRNPWRPLPFGLIPIVTAEAAVFATLVLGLGLSVLNGFDSLIIGASLVVAISAYNLELKHIPWLGPLALGLCRGLSVLLGAFAVRGNPPLSAEAGRVAGAVAVYILGLSLYARFERQPRLPVWAGIAPFLGACGAIALCAPLWYTLSPGRLLVTLTLLAALAGGAFLVLVRAWRPARTGSADDLERVSAVGLLLRGLIFFQAAVVSMTGAAPLQIVVLCILLAAWPLHALMEKSFYAS